MKLKTILLEKVGSKELSSEKLEKVLRNYLIREFDYERTNIDWVEVRDLDFKLEVILPQEVLDDTDWNDFFKKYGYFIKEIWGKKDKYDSVEVHLMPYKTEKIQSENIPDILYHATPMNKILKVFENGLVPKEIEKIEGRIDEPRIYFSTENNESFQKLQDQLKDVIPEKPPFGDEVAVLEIDTTNLGDRVNFYSDPEVLDDSFVYTKSYIPPSAIDNCYEYEEEKNILINRKYY